jgi:hypothetical protein
MIDIVIPYWFGAGIAFAIMMLCLLGIGGSILVRCPQRAILFLLLLFLVDGFAAVASYSYMTTPINTENGVCIGGDESSWTYSSAFPPCVYPTVNPYEEQPLHPIMWIVDVFSGAFYIMTHSIVIREERK